jgi:hypothetical protein
MTEDPRETLREPIALPVRLADGRIGVTRDISPGGLFLEFDGPAPWDGGIDFEMEVPEARMKFSAQGWIVRVECREGRTGVAVKLLNARIEPLALAPD